MSFETVREKIDDLIEEIEKHENKVFFYNLSYYSLMCAVERYVKTVEFCWDISPDVIDDGLKLLNARMEIESRILQFEDMVRGRRAGSKPP